MISDAMRFSRAEGVHHRRSRITHAVRFTFRKERITQKSLFCPVDKRDFFLEQMKGVEPSYSAWEADI
ncbi:MAG: hypothetical protein ACI4SJ_02495, partial [Candidatus Avispirillum sp.]